MAQDREARKAAYVGQARAAFDELAARGITASGNAFCDVLLLKGALDEKDHARLLSGADGEALRSALLALGYAPEAWAALATVDEADLQLAPDLLRETVCAFDPSTLIACDEEAAALVRQAYADELAANPSMACALLEPGYVVDVLGMRVLNLGGFAASLADAQQKQLMWARLKLVKPLGRPY